MKNILYGLLLAPILSLSGCGQTEMIDYQSAQEAVNFYSLDEGIDGNNQDSYPELLTKIYEINTYSNNRDGVEAVAVDFTIQTMGEIGNEDRKAVMRAKETKGYQAELPYKEVTVPGGQNLVVLEPIPITYIPKGYMTTWVIEFDYDAGDFAPGLEERKQRTITIDNRYTYSSVNISDDQWEVIAGAKADDLIGLGPFSSIKAMFIVNLFGIYDFYNFYEAAGAYQMYALYGMAKEGYEEFWKPIVEPLRDALEEYKANSAADPANYPPLLDDTKNDGTWISFVEE